MAESPKSPSLPKSIPRLDVGTLLQGDAALRPKLCFGIPGLARSQALTSDAGVNPFASPREEHQEVKLRNKLPDDLAEGWSFQGRKKHAPKLASPRLDAQKSPLTLTPSGTTLGGKRGPTSSEVHHTYFTSLGILVPPNQEFCRARVWPVLVRDKNSQKETLVHFKNQAPLNLPFSIRITGPTKIDWTQDSALADITQRIEIDLEEKILRYKLALKDRLHLEWSWNEELCRGGLECTILAHINTETSVISVQNKRHLHWKALDFVFGMNNEIEFSAPAHNLLMKTRTESAACHAHKNHAASTQASLQVARKKRYTKLNITTLEPLRMDSVARLREKREVDGGGQDSPPSTSNKTPGLIAPPAARNRLTYD
ncbi:unnamed protein product [Sphagnum balticum]